MGKLAGASPRPPQLDAHARPPQPTRFGMHGVDDRRRSRRFPARRSGTRLIGVHDGVG
jgi:hypothetical protein